MSNTASQLVERATPFFHATNLRDFLTYAKAGAVLCRQNLKSLVPRTHSFESDDADEAQGILSRVFGNLSDFSGHYASGRRGAKPNFYGPITIEFSPQVYGVLPDLVVTRLSVFPPTGGNWRDNALELDADGAPLFAQDGDDDNLGFSYGHLYAEASFDARSIPLGHVRRIIVEDISLCGHPLKDQVVQIWDKYVNREVGIELRHYCHYKDDVPGASDSWWNGKKLNKWADQASAFEGSSAHLFAKIHTDDEKIERDLNRWIRHFYDGSVRCFREHSD